MRLGIDLGTTRTVVAASDRGNYPIVGLLDSDDCLVEHFPTVSAERNGELVHGFAAEQVARAGGPHLRSWKRLLGRHGPEHLVRIGTVELSLLDLTTAYLGALHEALRDRSNRPRRRAPLPPVVISVPANAHSSQRFTTLEGFRRAGFEVTAMLNEPSAAGIEFAHRHRDVLNEKRDHVAVYDLGGGTFDAALVLVAGDRHEVIDTAGVQELGGDDFDAVLLDMALGTLRRAPPVTEAVRARLLFECRCAKEAIGANSRRIVLELAALGRLAPRKPVVLGVSDYYGRLRPLIERSFQALHQVMSPAGEEDEIDDLKRRAADAGVAGVYVVGGGASLPCVTRYLREQLGRRVHRSVHPAGATAIGLAIAAAEAVPLRLKERLTRHLGVFREAEAGSRVVFDQILPRGTRLPRAGEAPLVVTRAYRAAHNIGYFRFVECGALSRTHEPDGDISPLVSFRFPFTSDVRGRPLEGVPIERLASGGHQVEERYEVDASGVIAVTVSDLDDGHSESFVL